MRSLRLALVAIAALTAAPLAAEAQGYGQSSRAPAAREQESKDERPERGSRSRGKKPAAAAAGGDKVKGMAEAPAVVQAAGVRCAVSDAVLLGQQKSAEGLDNVYEVACSDGPGYFLIAKPDKTLRAGYECLQLRDGAATAAAAGEANPNAPTCKLPGNADLLGNFAKRTSTLISGCTIDAARWLGASPSTQDSIYEIGCNGRPGAIVRLGLPGSSKAPSVTACERIAQGDRLQCEYTSTEEKLAPVKTLVAASDRKCTVAQTNFMGTSSSGSGDEYHEIKCADGAGFVLVASQGAVKRTVTCAQAMNIGDGCSLTDGVEAQQQDASIYKGLAQKAGFACDVDKYRLLGIESGGAKREVVELACKDKPEGAIGFFPVSAGGTTDLYDCTKNWRHKQSCTLTTLAAVKPRLTRDITANGKACDVTAYRGGGMTSKGETEFVEVACASGPGLMIEYAAKGAPLFAPATGVFTCTEAKNIGEGCKLASK